MIPSSTFIIGASPHKAKAAATSSPNNGGVGGISSYADGLKNAELEAANVATGATFGLGGGGGGDDDRDGGHSPWPTFSSDVEYHVQRHRKADTIVSLNVGGTRFEVSTLREIMGNDTGQEFHLPTYRIS